MKSPRARNNATWYDVAAFLTSIYPSRDDAALSVPGFYYDFIVAHEEFLVKLVAVTNRPTATLGRASS